jgi:hypothetical protein
MSLFWMTPAMRYVRYLFGPKCLFAENIAGAGWIAGHLLEPIQTENVANGRRASWATPYLRMAIE